MFKFPLYALILILFYRIFREHRDKKSFPSTEEKFNSSSIPTFKDKSEYSLSVVVVNDDEYEEESNTTFSIQKVKFALNELLMQ